MLLTFSGNNSPTQWSWRRGVQRCSIHLRLRVQRVREQWHGQLWACDFVCKCASDLQCISWILWTCEWCSWVVVCVCACAKVGASCELITIFCMRKEQQQSQRTFEAAFSFWAKQKSYLGRHENLRAKRRKYKHSNAEQSGGAVTQKRNKQSARKLFV